MDKQTNASLKLMYANEDKSDSPIKKSDSFFKNIFKRMTNLLKRQLLLSIFYSFNKFMMSLRLLLLKYIEVLETNYWPLFLLL